MKNTKSLLQKIRINPSREHLVSFMREAATTVIPGERILDAGAGYFPYKDLFLHAIYHSTDLQRKTKGISFLSDLSALPIANRTYKKVICCQVLEHLNEPEKALREIHRSLSLGGELWLTAPFYYEEHEVPMDFYRFTQYGIRYLIEKAGFRIKSLEWLEGYYGTLSYEMIKTARMLPIDPRAFGHPLLGIPISLIALFIKPLFFLLGILFSRLDLKYKQVSSGHSKNYAVVAVKDN